MDTARSSSECHLCQQLPQFNIDCSECSKVFCKTCLAAHYDANPSQINQCPACHYELKALHSSHNPDLQSKLDGLTVDCKYCQQPQPLQGRDAHQAACGAAIVACPFKGCAFESARSVLDVHVVTCSHSQLYSATAVLDLICRRCEEQQLPSLHPSLFNGLQQAVDVVEDDRIVHQVQDTDTLAGLAVRYHCHQTDIKRLNRLMSDVALYGRRTVIIPRTGELPLPVKDAIPVSVLVALRKRQLTRMLCRKCKLSEEEAVSYLHMTHFDVVKAEEFVKADDLWTQQHTSEQPDNMLAFLQRLAGGVGKCHGCQGRLASDRTSCSNCGHFYCGKCQKDRRECQNIVSKAMLGSTNPETRHDGVNVCRECYQVIQTDLLRVVQSTSI
eukprot:m.72739 g.72739  ORF g.72739 m.72739 type:complete len:385 (+) comp14277_c0_seq1:209-1363(+)